MVHCVVTMTVGVVVHVVAEMQQWRKCKVAFNVHYTYFEKKLWHECVKTDTA